VSFRTCENCKDSNVACEDVERKKRRYPRPNESQLTKEMVNDPGTEKNSSEPERACKCKQERESRAFGFQSVSPTSFVRGALFDQEGRLLMVKQRDDGGWTLPGGCCDANYSPSENVERAILENTGYQVRVKGIIGIFDKQKHSNLPSSQHQYITIFSCEIRGGSLVKNSPEIESFKFFKEEEIPFDLSFSILSSFIPKLVFEHYRNPNKPPWFD